MFTQNFLRNQKRTGLLAHAQKDRISGLNTSPSSSRQVRDQQWYPDRLLTNLVQRKTVSPLLVTFDYNKTKEVVFSQATGLLLDASDINGLRPGCKWGYFSLEYYYALEQSKRSSIYATKLLELLEIDCETKAFLLVSAISYVNSGVSIEEI